MKYYITKNCVIDLSEIVYLNIEDKGKDQLAIIIFKTCPNPVHINMIGGNTDLYDVYTRYIRTGTAE